ncbi:MAG: GIN domain-containing protein [Mucilaginibacter sp.]
MKTLILTAALSIATVAAISNTTFAADGNTGKAATVLTEVNNINAIEVHGNVEVYVSNGNADQVKVYNEYYSDNAMVQDSKGTLRIASYGNQKLTVWVTANQLQKLSVYDNATVKSFGKLSAIDLDVELYNNATANLSLDTFGTAVTLNNNAKAELAGNVTNGFVKFDNAAALKTADLKVQHLVKTENTAKEELTEIAAL